MQTSIVECVFSKFCTETSLLYLSKYLIPIYTRSNQCHCVLRTNHNQQSRKYIISTRYAQKSFSKAVSDAEKLVGYPTSFLSLRCLLSDEVSNIAFHMRKLVGTKHPLLKTARGMVFDGKNNLQLRGLLVMLISKAAGPNSLAPYSEHEMISGVYPSQRALAEITEVIYTANLIHKGIVNLKDILPDDGPLSDMEFGNKMAVLSGDYLLSSACNGLAKLGNPSVVELVAGALGDMMKAEFTDFAQTCDKHNTSSICTRFSDWLKQTRLSLGSLLANSCRSAMALASHSKYLEEMAFSFGENATYAQQLSKDILSFSNQDEQTSMLSLAPVILSRELASEEEINLVSKRSLENVYSNNEMLDLVDSTRALEQCQELCIQYRNKAIASLDCFKTSDAKLALINMVTAISSMKK